MYETSSDVLGVLISRAADQPLQTFFRERIFAPLGMNDTGFCVPAEKLDRLASCYSADPETGTLELYDDADDSRWSRPPVFESCGGELISTVDDYLAFCRMMLNEGRYGGERILSRPSVALMTTDHLTLEQRIGADMLLGDSGGWGFGMSVVTKRDGLASTPGRFGWDGGYGTSGYSDPEEDMVGILMTQRLAGPDSPRIDLDFWTLPTGQSTIEASHGVQPTVRFCNAPVGSFQPSQRFLTRPCQWPSEPQCPRGHSRSSFNH